jgi:hypothetical protein
VARLGGGHGRLPQGPAELVDGHDRVGGLVRACSERHHVLAPSFKWEPQDRSVDSTELRQLGQAPIKSRWPVQRAQLAAIRMKATPQDGHERYEPTSWTGEA